MVRAAMNRKNEKHGLSESPEYVAWSCMIDRCVNERNRRYKDYGGRGIAVCDRWRYSFLAFLGDVGYRPEQGMSIERKDNNGHYEAGNVYWATPKQQAANRRTNRLVTMAGRTLTVSEWAREIGVKRSTLEHRIDTKWPEDKILLRRSFRGNRKLCNQPKRRTL